MILVTKSTLSIQFTSLISTGFNLIQLDFNLNSVNWVLVFRASYDTDHFDGVDLGDPGSRVPVPGVNVSTYYEIHHVEGYKAERPTSINLCFDQTRPRLRHPLLYLFPLITRLFHYKFKSNSNDLQNMRRFSLILWSSNIFDQRFYSLNWSKIELSVAFCLKSIKVWENLFFFDRFLMILPIEFSWYFVKS